MGSNIRLGCLFSFGVNNSRVMILFGDFGLGSALSEDEQSGVFAAHYRSSDEWNFVMLIFVKQGRTVKINWRILFNQYHTKTVRKPNALTWLKEKQHFIVGFWFTTLKYWNRDSSVGTETGLWGLENRGTEVQFQARVRGWSSSKHSEHLWDQNIITLNWHRKTFRKVKRPRCKADHPPISSVEVNNEWSYNSSLSYSISWCSMKNNGRFKFAFTTLL